MECKVIEGSIKGGLIQANSTVVFRFTYTNLSGEKKGEHLLRLFLIQGTAAP